MSNLSSSAVVFSGYHPIEVTASDFEKTVDNNEYSHSNGSERKKENSLTKRFGEFLSSSRKKKDVDSDRNSVSGLSSTGQQSVASITVYSGTTIKASNLHQEQAETKSGLVSLPLVTNHFIESNSGIGPSGNKQDISTNNNKHHSIRPPKPWKSLKRFVVRGRHNKLQSGSTTSQSSSDLNQPGSHIQRSHAKSHDGAESFSSNFPLNTTYPVRKRFHSEGVEKLTHPTSRERDSFSEGLPSETLSQHAIDQAIRGRLDGIDILSLGPASQTSLSLSPSDPKLLKDGVKGNENGEKKASGGGESENFDFLHSSFTGPQSPASPAKIIDEMIWTLAGMGQAELILEGFYPGCNDRWGVRITNLSSPVQSQSEDQSERKPYKRCSEDEKEASTFTPTPNYHIHPVENNCDESTATNTTDNDGSTNLPIAELWDSLWGIVDSSPPIPSHMNLVENATGNNIDFHEDLSFVEDEDTGHQFAAACNVPIDLDDDAFIINCPKHVKSIHEVAMIPLQARRYCSALSIFEKLQRGLDGSKKYSHLVASTSHNIGMIQLYRGNYEEALKSFQKAVEIRKECLPADHPDIAVSLQREGMAHFALDSMVEALKSFEAALAICSSMDNTRAKILNNIGVARYQLEDYPQALKSFTSALEIQRPWLEGPIRRESIVYNASTVLSNMGKVYLREGYHDLAHFVFEEACLMQTSIFRKDDDLVLRSLENMARAQSMDSNYSEALLIFTSLYQSQESKFGPNSKACIETLGLIGMSHFKLLDYEEAGKCMNAVETWQTHVGGMDESYDSFKIVTNHLQQIKRCLQEKEPVWV